MKSIEDIKIIGKATNVFYFKQFSVKDDRSTMKLGTDAVLLGIAADITNVRNILEIGTGCGIIALILAQRSEAEIDALEIDEESVIQAKENVAASSWKERIKVIHSSLQDFTPEDHKKYDLIISNPPFFSGTFKSHKTKRNIARHHELLTFDELIGISGGLLNDDGSLWVILPVKESLEFISKAEPYGFFVHFMMKIIPKVGKEYNRVILEMKKEEISGIRFKTLTHWEADGDWSEDFKRFTREFYVDF
jgi:tRNA1Val (adenine37-N6)-methyltransferase